MTAQLPALLLLIPLTSAMIMPIAGQFSRTWCRPVLLAALTAMGITSLEALRQVSRHGTIRYDFSGWMPPLGIEWRLDGLSAIVLVLLSFVALVAMIYAKTGIREQFGRKLIQLDTLVLLLVAALAGMILAADFFNLFVFLEVASLSAYALVAVAGGRAMLSAFRYLIMGTIGASFYLLGVGYLYAATGTLNMADLAVRVAPISGSMAVLSGIVFIMIGLGIKMALVPLHGWQPDAYAHAPDPISPLLAALMTKVALYAVARIIFWVFGIDLLFTKFPFIVFLGWIGAIAMLAGAFLALSEQNLKRMFAYGGLSHVGLIVLGISLGSRAGLSAGVFYLLVDTVMQLGLFFTAGVIIHQHGVGEIAGLARVSRRIPLTLATLIVTGLSMVGIPPTGGFFGKWFLVLAAMETGDYLAVGVIVLGTLLTLAAFARLFEKILMEEAPEPTPPVRETSAPMRFGMGAVIAALILLGLFSDPVMRLISRIALPPGILS
jgi:multicomponent Na+:H+ antiporter subunit D